MEANRDWADRTLFIDQTAFTYRMLENLGILKSKSGKRLMHSGTEMVQIDTKLKTTRPKTKRSKISVTY